MPPNPSPDRVALRSQARPHPAPTTSSQAGLCRTALLALVTLNPIGLAWAGAPAPVGSKPPSHTESTITPSITANATNTEIARLTQRLQALYPATRFGEIRSTPWNGVYEVSMGNNLAYVDASGQYFVFGHLYDMQAQRDLSAERKDSLARVDFSGLPLGDAIREVHGRGTRVIAVFSDPDCPYCRQLERTLKDLPDVTLHTFLMPLDTLHPQARDKAIAVWCAADRLAAWQALMRPGAENSTADPNTRPAPSCDHPIDRNLALAERLGIQGTPTLVSADGRLLPGAASANQLEAWLSRSTSTSTSTSTHPSPRSSPSPVTPPAPKP